MRTLDQEAAGPRSCCQDGHGRHRGVGADLTARAFGQRYACVRTLSCSRLSTQLGGQFHQLGNARCSDRMPSAQESAAGIDWQRSTNCRDAIAYEFETTIAIRKTEMLVEHYFRRCRSIVYFRYMNVARAQAVLGGGQQEELAPRGRGALGGPGAVPPRVRRPRRGAAQRIVLTGGVGDEHRQDASLVREQGMAGREVGHNVRCDGASCRG